MERQIPKATLIIVNYNAGKWLEPCVRSVIDQTEQDFECFIVDNGSADGSLETLPELDGRFEIIKMNYNAGFAVGNNHAAKLANSPWIALLNPDAFARPDWLAQLLKAKSTLPHITMVGSTQYLALEKPVLDGVGDCYHASGIAYRAGYGKHITPPATGLVFGPCAAAALYHTETFLSLGGFDERFFCYHEDVDIAFRMQLAGGECVQSAEAIVDHVSSAISSTIPDFAIYHGTRNRIWTFFKNMPWPLMIVLAPLHIGANVAYMSWSLVRKDRMKPTWRGVIDGIKGLPLVLKDRKTVQASRTVSSLALARKLTWSPRKAVRRTIHIRDISR